ncbi:hypothetical protein cyc_00210 [Cyclospora cayetanensis]|uniref:Uncharacterized protein n=1 Tax=Cyclospora cayetanensis TaxID=88456 RepID=A0A1D3D693_9EIME|nr:hypothetical protein cyc_00210 [Cyclospora cayetanensis]
MYRKLKICHLGESSIEQLSYEEQAKCLKGITLGILEDGGRRRMRRRASEVSPYWRLQPYVADFRHGEGYCEAHRKGEMFSNEERHAVVVNTMKYIGFCFTTMQNSSPSKLRLLRTDTTGCAVRARRGKERPLSFRYPTLIDGMQRIVNATDPYARSGKVETLIFGNDVHGLHKSPSVALHLCV